MHKIKFLPNKENIILLIICGALSSFLLFIGYEGDPPISVPPGILLIISVIALLLELRTIELKQDVVSINYLFIIKRKILRKRINAVAFVSCKKTIYLFISLDKCPTYVPSKYGITNQGIKNYIFLHPLKLISLDIPYHKRTKYCNIISKIYPDIIFIGEDGAHSTGDGFA